MTDDLIIVIVNWLSVIGNWLSFEGTRTQTNLPLPSESPHPLNPTYLLMSHPISHSKSPPVTPQNPFILLYIKRSENKWRNALTSPPISYNLPFRASLPMTQADAPLSTGNPIAPERSASNPLRHKIGRIRMGTLSARSAESELTA